MRQLLGVVVGVFALACDASPLEAPRSHGVSADIDASQASGAGVQKQPISGIIEFVSGGPPGTIRVSPGGICHFTDNPVITRMQGDIVGEVTFSEHNQLTCSGGHLRASGPFDGEVTWNERPGHISGQFETNCLADPSQPAGVSCDGTVNARGSGGLDGVHFHFTWGPGWFPFPYSGTAFTQ